jgi:hypothetical protein
MNTLDIVVCTLPQTRGVSIGGEGILLRELLDNIILAAKKTRRRSTTEDLFS